MRPSALPRLRKPEKNTAAKPAEFIVNIKNWENPAPRFLAGRSLFAEIGFGLIGDVAVGAVGALLGDWLLPRFHISFWKRGAGLIVGTGAVVVRRRFACRGHADGAGR